MRSKMNTLQKKSKLSANIRFKVRSILCEFDFEIFSRFLNPKLHAGNIINIILNKVGKNNSQQLFNLNGKNANNLNAMNKNYA